MKPSEPCILTINGGSSSVKFAVYPTVDQLKRTLYGTVGRIGMSGTNLTFHVPATNPQNSRLLDASDHKSAAPFWWIGSKSSMVSNRSEPWDTASSTACNW
jgi:acetate kinase